RRQARLSRLAQREAQRAQRTGQSVALEPMTQAERRIVHLALRDWEGVETRSEGEEPYRRVVIVPAGE
ncbi:MAG: single-stranded DNA-binding protein, partial [Thermoleophilia bacterium]